MCTFFHNISQIGIFCALFVSFTKTNIPIITQNFRFIFQQVMQGAGELGRTEAWRHGSTEAGVFNHESHE